MLANYLANMNRAPKIAHQTRAGGAAAFMAGCSFVPKSPAMVKRSVRLLRPGADRAPVCFAAPGQKNPPGAEPPMPPAGGPARDRVVAVGVPIAFCIMPCRLSKINKFIKYIQQQSKAGTGANSSRASRSRSWDQCKQSRVPSKEPTSLHQSRSFPWRPAPTLVVLPSTTICGRVDGDIFRICASRILQSPCQTTPAIHRQPQS
jgi:hypothetical protein